MNRIIKMIDKNVNIDEMSPANLAYVGDAVFEIYVRSKITLEANRTIKDLNKEAMKYVKANMQAECFKHIEEKLTEEELEIYKRCRNHKGSISSKSATVSDYRMATGLEGLLAYLFLKERFDRLDEIMEEIFKFKNEQIKE
ncbi:MAG: ribonuclease III [Clostridia bacterium]|nr:ribonuclease III [Clostridia bacterium]